MCTEKLELNVSIFYSIFYLLRAIKNVIPLSLCIEACAI